MSTLDVKNRVESGGFEFPIDFYSDLVHTFEHGGDESFNAVFMELDFVDRLKFVSDYLLKNDFKQGKAMVSVAMKLCGFVYRAHKDDEVMFYGVVSKSRWAVHIERCSSDGYLELFKVRANEWGGIYSWLKSESDGLSCIERL